MKVEINTLRKLLLALSLIGAMLAAIVIPAQAQRRGGPNRRHVSPPYGRAYGYYDRQNRRARHDYRKAAKRDLKRHQRSEREAFRDRIRDERSTSDNSRDFRLRTREERRALRIHQREENRTFRQSVRNNRRRS
ncbi:MAG TPA: hypothetical protein VGB17_03200 [Pyrinomonadaceae bacterium]|jgi:hypothetical protein